MGVGATGARAARQLASTDAVDTVIVADADPAQRRKVADLLGAGAEASDAVVPEADVVLLATPAGTQARPRGPGPPPGQLPWSPPATTWTTCGRLLDLDAEAVERGADRRRRRRLRPGPQLPAGPPRRVAPSTRSTRSTSPRSAPAARPAPSSTTGPSASDGLDWRDGGWVSRTGGSGRELCWFPDPVGGRDCYRAARARPAAAGRRLPADVPGHRPPRPPTGGTG